MNDSDKTVFSGKGVSGVAGAPQQSSPQNGESEKPKKNLLIIGGLGCALLLCVALLVGGGAFYFLGGDDSSVAELLDSYLESPTPTLEAPTDEPTATATPLPSPTPVPEETADTGSEADEAAETDSGEAEATPTESEDTTPAEPEIGDITFAEDATDDYEPVGPASSFEPGITEIHAIFEYSGMSADYNWERIWYLDGNEILRSPKEGEPPEAWSGAEVGVFDYFINNAGNPLPPGQWLLEIYVAGDLLATDTFTIEGEEEEEPEPVAEATTAPTPTSSPTPSPSPTTKPSSAGGGGGGTYQLAYTKWDGGQHNLYVADTNGSGEQFVFGRAAGPSWSPDGGSIFFYGEQGVDRQVVNGVDYVVDGISDGIVAITASPLPASPDQAELFQGLDWKQGTARWANVSPDGNMVAFDANYSGNYRIYFLGTDDNQQFRFEIIGEQADWSPDSQQIVYRSGRDGQTGVWISNRDDSGHTIITNGGSDSFPAWSPNGKIIAFSRDEGGNVDIYTVNVDGSNLLRLTDAPGPDTLPIFTPSGDIIFRSARSGSWSIWKMSSTGAGQKEIIPNASVGPDWAFSKMDVR